MDTPPPATRSVWLDLTADEREWFEERAAIIEHLAGAPRHWAEVLATQVLRERRARGAPRGTATGSRRLRPHDEESTLR